MIKKLLFLVVVTPLFTSAESATPYAGQEKREIKSLSAQQIEALHRGDGMGLAKLAELNHYPGPKHVLQLSNELELSTDQRAATESLYSEMETAAISYGKDIVDAEAALDEQFAKGAIDAQSLQVALLEIGRLRGLLRYVHLDAHLKQKALLTEDQVVRYDELRGYAESDHSHHEHHEHHGHREEHD